MSASMIDDRSATSAAPTAHGSCVWARARDRASRKVEGSVHEHHAEALLWFRSPSCFAVAVTTRRAVSAEQLHASLANLDGPGVSGRRAGHRRTRHLGVPAITASTRADAARALGACRPGSVPPMDLQSRQEAGEISGRSGGCDRLSRCGLHRYGTLPGGDRRVTPEPVPCSRPCGGVKPAPRARHAASSSTSCSAHGRSRDRRGSIITVLACSRAQGRQPTSSGLGRSQMRCRGPCTIPHRARLGVGSPSRGNSFPRPPITVRRCRIAEPSVQNAYARGRSPGAMASLADAPRGRAGGPESLPSFSRGRSGLGAHWAVGGRTRRRAPLFSPTTCTWPSTCRTSGIARRW